MRVRPSFPRRRGRGAVARLGAAAMLLPVAARAPLYGQLLWSLLRDERVPLARKGLLAVAVGYVVLGRDLVADAVPILGAVDDFVAVALAVDLFFDGVPRPVLDEYLTALGLDRRTFEADVAQLRRLVPSPIRRLVRGLPRLLGRVGPAVRFATPAVRRRPAATTEGSRA